MSLNNSKSSQRWMWLVFVIVSTLFASVFLVYHGILVVEKYQDLNHKPYQNGESSFVENGMCQCCKCGLMDCAVCAKKKSECCLKDETFDRYTFSQNEYGKMKSNERPSW